MDVKRILHDLKELQDHTLADMGIYYFPDESDLHRGQALIIGPKQTPYEFGFYLFNFEIPKEYPRCPPIVKYRTMDAHTRFHPQLYCDGYVCLSTIHTWAGPCWTSVQTISSVLLSLLSLLDEHPLQNEPNLFGHVSPEESERYHLCLRHENLRLSVIKTLGLCPYLPPDMAKIMKNYFRSHYDDYLRICADYQSQDGRLIQMSYYRFAIQLAFNHLKDSLEAVQRELFSKNE